jgi:hypothetical protein
LQAAFLEKVNNFTSDILTDGLMLQELKLGCGVAQLVVRRLAVRQARVRFSARHPMEVLLLVSEEAMRIQEDGPRRMVKDK